MVISHLGPDKEIRFFFTNTNDHEMASNASDKLRIKFFGGEALALGVMLVDIGVGTGTIIIIVIGEGGRVNVAVTKGFSLTAGLVVGVDVVGVTKISTKERGCVWTTCQCR